MSEQKYFAANDQEHETEFTRLKLLEQFFDPTTIRHLEMLHPAEGWNCLDVGAGAGSVAQWLTTRVGPTGRVVATDIDTRFLSQLSAPNLEIRRHDIIKDELETGQYDLVHCRFLLMHLPEPEKALKRMSNAVRPDGWLLIEEMDYGSTLSIDITNPAFADVTAIMRASLDFIKKIGILDPYFGRRVRSLVEQLEFVDLGQEGWTLVVRGGDPIQRWGKMTVQAGGKYLIAAGLTTQERLDNTLRLVSNPDFYFPGATVFAAWGRRPFDKS
jgi:SAM-dependent methyltransferase